MSKVLPGFLLALSLAIAGKYLSELIGITWMGLPKSPISAIMIAILLGILIRNTVSLPERFKPGIQFGLVRILRLGIVLLGIRLSLGEVGAIGLKSLPVIIGAVLAALLIVTYFGRKLGLSGRLGTLIAVGTSICGATAIVATAPAIGAHDDEVSYSVACITMFGVIAMLVYPFAAHWMFAADPFAAGLFLGTAVHETPLPRHANRVLSGRACPRRLHRRATLRRARIPGGGGHRRTDGRSRRGEAHLVSRVSEPSSSPRGLWPGGPAPVLVNASSGRSHHRSSIPSAHFAI